LDAVKEALERLESNHGAPNKAVFARDMFNVTHYQGLSFDEWYHIFIMVCIGTTDWISKQES
jgi:hypothetical protein